MSGADQDALRRGAAALGSLRGMRKGRVVGPEVGLVGSVAGVVDLDRFAPGDDFRRGLRDVSERFEHLAHLGSRSRWPSRRDGQGSALPKSWYEFLVRCANLARF